MITRRPISRAITSGSPRAHDLLTPDKALVTLLEHVAPGRVHARASDRLAYAHDASHYRLTPSAVVTAENLTEVVALMQLATRIARPLTFRSGGTSLSGQASTDEIVVDTRRHFRTVTVLDNGERVRSEPGATVRAVNLRLAKTKRKLGPDPASESACTIGGVVANNSSGMACGIAANTYETLESCVLVLPSGSTLDTSQPDADDQLRHQEPGIHQGLVSLRDRVRSNDQSVDTIRRLFALKNTMGYGINAFLDFDTPIDILQHLVVGSEGTLAFVASTTFRTVPVNTYVATGLLFFDDLTAATTALPALVAAGFATIELLDAASLRIAQQDKDAGDELRRLIVRDHAALLVEFQDPNADTLSQHLEAADALFASLRLSTPARLTSDPVTRAALWHIRKGLYALVAGNRPPGTTALLEDIAIPVGSLLSTCTQLIALFEKHDYHDSVIFGHAKDGNIHFMLNESFDHEGKLDRYLGFTEDLVTLVLAQGGTLKAEHGTGRMMAPYVRRQYGDELYEVMVAIKHLIDPAGILNPGVVINADPKAHVRNLKPAIQVEAEVDRCVECGYCEPVCPSRDLTLTPRQRIVLRREMAHAEREGDSALLEQLRDEYQYDAVDTCAVDGMCQTACPVSINTGDLVRRLRAEQTSVVEQRGWKAAAQHWGVATRLGAIALTVTKAAPSALPSTATIVARTLLGADTVPLYSADLPRGGTRRRVIDADQPEIVYFSACINTMFGPAGEGDGVSAAFLRLCERAGIAVRTPKAIESLCCGTPWKSKGLTDGFKVMQDRVRSSLREATDNGRIPVVCDASSCTEGLFALLNEPTPEFTVLDAVEFVDARILPVLPVGTRIPALVLHPTCSSTHLGTNDALLRIAGAVADHVVVPDDWNCCAFAGDRGMLHPELTASATAREAANVRPGNADAYASTNRTCELGMSRATGHDYRHLLEILDEAQQR